MSLVRVHIRICRGIRFLACLLLTIFFQPIHTCMSETIEYDDIPPRGYVTVVTPPRGYVTVVTQLRRYVTVVTQSREHVILVPSLRGYVTMIRRLKYTHMVAPPCDSCCECASVWLSLKTTCVTSFTESPCVFSVPVAVVGTARPPV